MKYKGLHPRTTYTRAYRGMLVKDNGFHEILKKLIKKYTDSLDILADTPFIGSKVTIEYERPITLTIFKKRSLESTKIDTFWSICDHVWYFSKDGDMIDIYNFLDSYIGDGML